MSKVERTRKAIFEKYPKAVIYFEYDYGEILFFPNEYQSHDDENLHSGFIKNGKLFDITDF